MGLQKHYLRYGRAARDCIFNWLGIRRSHMNQHINNNNNSNSNSNNNSNNNNNSTYNSDNSNSYTINNSNSNEALEALDQDNNTCMDTVMASAKEKHYNGNCTTTSTTTRTTTTKMTISNNQGRIRNRSMPLSMLISQGANLSNSKLAVIIIGIVTLIIGTLLTTIPWLDYFILQNLRLWNDTISYHYWQRPGVIRLTKVYIFNVTNPDGFLNGEKPKLQEVGPFVYREDMQKVNIKFHENYTVSYQHKKILEFVPELSIDNNTLIVTPNIPLLTLTSLSPKLGYVLSKTISVILTAAKFKPFISITADQLVFGYDDPLVSLAHRFYPKSIRPMERMGLLLARNGTLTEVSTIKTGFKGMHEFGYIDRLNGLDRLPHWHEPPCTSLTGSEGSFFPPRDITKSDIVYIYDKDLCRVIPLQYVKSVDKDGINADLYVLPEDAYGGATNNTHNKCFDTRDYKAPKGLQNISPCQYGAPVYISNPHFYQADRELKDTVKGLTPQKELHETYFKIQPKLGVPLEGKVRIQLNLRVTQAKNVFPVKNFRTFVFPIMWVEEGISDLTPAIRRWIYLATVFAPTIIPWGSYLMIMGGAIAIVYSFVRAYQNYVFASDPTHEILEMGRRSLRRGSSYIQHQHKLLHRESYILLKNTTTTITRHISMPSLLVTNSEEAIPIINSVNS